MNSVTTVLSTVREHAAQMGRNRPHAQALPGTARLPIVAKSGRRAGRAGVHPAFAIASALLLLLVAVSPAVGKSPLAAAGLDVATLDQRRQLIVFEAAACAYCKQFEAEVLDRWQADVAVARTLSAAPPGGWTLEKALFATPTIVLFENRREVSRFTGYDGDAQRF